MATYANREIMPNTLGMPFNFLSLSLIILLRLGPAIRRLEYYGIRLEDCEGTS